MRATELQLIRDDQEATPQRVVVCGDACAARYLVGSQARARSQTVVDLQRCSPCAECGLVTAGDHCPTCGGSGCGVHDWSATRQAAEFARAWEALSGEAPSPVEREAARIFARVRPRRSGKRIAEALMDAAPDVALLEADLDHRR